LRHDAITATGTSSSSCVKVSCTWACCCSYTSRRPLASRAARAAGASTPLWSSVDLRFHRAAEWSTRSNFLCCSASSVGIAAYL
jgi:hypothetical protein